MSTEVEVQSGYQKGRISILTAARKAAVNAVRQALVRTAAQTVLSVAQETGAMRVGYAMALEKTGFRVSIGKKRIVIRGAEVLRYMESIGSSAAPYIVHHIRESAEFNRNFINGYTNPTSANTEPISIDKLMVKIHSNVRAFMKQALAREGLNVR